MITVTVIGSGSKGNAYQVDDDNTRLLIECGLPWSKIKRALNYETSSISGALVSHEHGDHSKSVKDVSQNGIDIYLSKGTADAIDVKNHRIHYIKAMDQFNIGTWTILAFDTVHDATEPLGFLLVNRTGEKLLFLTDSSFCKYKFKRLTHLMLECNFSNEILDKNIAAGRVERSRKSRLLESHFSLNRVKEFLKANDLSRLQAIWLMHLSDDNSNEEQFKSEIQQLTGKPVTVC